MENEPQLYEAALENSSIALIGLWTMLGNYQGLSRNYRSIKLASESKDIVVCLKAVDSFLSGMDSVFDDEMLYVVLGATLVEKDAIKLTLSDGYSIFGFNLSPKTAAAPVRLLKATQQSGVRWSALLDRTKAITTRLAQTRKDAEAPVEQT